MYRGVFTIPRLLRLHFRFDRRPRGLLSACAHQSVLEMMRAVVCEPGAVALDTISKAAHPDGFVRLDPLEGLAALIDHIPDKGQHLVQLLGVIADR